jgi:phosphate transport system permease protein
MTITTLPSGAADAQLETTAELVPVPLAVETEAMRQPPQRDDVPRPLRRRSVDDVSSLLGSAAGALAFVWVVYEHVLLWSGTLGFIVCTWVMFVALYAAVSLLSNPLPIVRDRVASVVVTSAAVLVGFALATTIVSTFVTGWPALHHLNFFRNDMSGVAPGTDPLTKGGVEHAIVGTGIEVALATLISLPLGLGTAIYLSEVGGRGAVVVRTVVEAMTALPDILAGLFIYVVLIILLGWERSGVAAAIALSVTMTPVIARSAEVVLRVVPSGLREAGLALGASRWQTVLRIVMPTARAGLATSLILGIARVAGETAPLLIVSGSTTFFNDNPFHQPMNSLPLYIYAGVKSGQGLYIQRAYGAASVLLFLVLVLFVITRYLARNRTGKR